MTENSATLSLGLNKPEEKPAEPKAEEAPQDDVQKPPFMQKDAAELAKIAKQAEKIRKREARRQRWEEKKIGKKLKIAGIAVGVLLILAIALSITLYWMAGAGKLPESLKPTGEKFRAFIDGKKKNGSRQPKPPSPGRLIWTAWRRPSPRCAAIRISRRTL